MKEEVMEMMNESSNEKDAGLVEMEEEVENDVEKEVEQQAENDVGKEVENMVETSYPEMPRKAALPIPLGVSESTILFIVCKALESYSRGGKLYSFMHTLLASHRPRGGGRGDTQYQVVTRADFMKLVCKVKKLYLLKVRRYHLRTFE